VKNETAVEEKVIVEKKLETASTTAQTSPNPKAVVRKTVSQPVGKLSSSNLGIKSLLDPKKEKSAEEELEQLETLNEKYSYEDLEYAWKDYALGIKRQKKDSLFATLMKSEMTLDSQHQIKLVIQNSIQAVELDKEKAELIQFLRKKLKNTAINLIYEITEKKDVKVLTSKSTFDKLAKENESLHKFRKLFNLDIDY
jgi:hypothetical protein